MTILFPKSLGMAIASNFAKPSSKNGYPMGKELPSEIRSENLRTMISVWRALGAMLAVAVLWPIFTVGIFLVLKNVAPEHYSSVREVLTH